MIKQHEGTMVCTACGLIQQLSMIDQTNEKRVFSNDLQGADQSSSRVQATGNRFMPQHDQIVITGNNKEANMLKKYPLSKQDGSARNLQEGQTKIRLVLESLNMNHADVKFQAFDFLKQIEDKKVLKGKSIDAKVATVIYFAARHCKRQQAPLDILKYCSCSKQEMNKCVKKCKQVFSSAPIPPSAIVEEACFKIGLPPHI